MSDLERRQAQISGIGRDGGSMAGPGQPPLRQGIFVSLEQDLATHYDDLQASINLIEQLGDRLGLPQPLPEPAPGELRGRIGDAGPSPQPEPGTLAALVGRSLHIGNANRRLASVIRRLEQL